MSAAPTTDPLSPAISRKAHEPRAGSQQFSPSTLLALLPKCSSLGEIHQLHSIALKSRLHDDPSVLSKFIHALSLKPTPHSMSYARKLFDRISHRDAVLFNTLSRGYSRSHHPQCSISLFSQMLHSSISPDAYSFSSLLKSCATALALPEGSQAHAASLKLGFSSNPFVLPSLISMYSQCGDVKAARTLFDRADDQSRCVVSYNSIITACVHGSRPSEALALFRELQARRLHPTFVTMLGVIAACALIGALDLGKWIHDYVKKNAFASHNVKVNTALIDMYAKCGSLDDAVCVFDQMMFRDTQAWSAMIMAYAIHGHGCNALSLFDKMLLQDIQPDDITFLGILYSCSHSGMVDQGLQYFHTMQTHHGILPGIKHYGCIVDLLARAGRLEEAYEFIKGLPIEPTPILWRTLLSACGGRGDVNLGTKVFNKIIELDDSHGGDYIILSNTCALNGRWVDVNRIRKLMNERGAVKVPGCSSIEVDSTVHEFFAGDGKHPDSKQVHRMVDEVLDQLKVVGYVPDTSNVHHMDLTEEAKEVSLRYHSEKLAIAYGLINTPPGTTIRLVKNLRICSDCHSMAKLVSMVFERRIILRDLNRFHHFDNGECSCGDYW